MKTKNIFKAVALAMLMPAMLLTTACSNEDDAINNGDNKKGYPLQVTVNVTRQGDKATTRATYNDGTKKLGFSTGDKLFVSGSATGAGKFAGALDYVPATGKFSGTIYTQNDYDGTADALFSAAFSRIATLLPNGYDSYNFLSINDKSTSEKYDDVVSTSIANAFVASETAKATGVEQLSCEQAYTYSSGFALEPANAVLNFTISGLEAGAKTVNLITKYSDMDYDQTISGSVTPNASGVATFAIGVPNNLVIKNVANNLTIGSSNFKLPSGTALAAGKIYNITRCVNAINGQFSVSSTKKVFFSKGNLQATTTDLGATWTWAFAANQWSYVGDAAANTSMKEDGSGTVTANGTVDLFGWVGASSSWTTAAKWGISASQTSADYGNVADEPLKSDWGNVPGIGTGWRTLTGGDTDREWNYLFNKRSASTVNNVENARYAKATVNDVKGVVLFPDSYTHPAGVTAPANINTANTNYNANTWSGANWTKMETAGCVFLPAGGYRSGTTVTNASEGGYYWTSTPTGNYAYRVFYTMSAVNTSTSTSYRYTCYSVRLVHDAN